MLATLTALAEPNRLRMLELLRSGPCAVGDIAVQLDLNQPQVSKHLRVLKEAGLVVVQARAQTRLYALSPEPLEELYVWLESYRRLWASRFDALDEVVAELVTKKQQKDKNLDRRKSK